MFELLYKALLSRIHSEILKPLGWKKDGANFRFYQADGLCRILNFQRSAFNDSTECRFCINIGIYYEAQPEISNRKFKPYDCILESRAAGISPKYRTEQWWSIFEGRDMEKLFQELKALIEEDVFAWFDRVPTRAEAIRRYGFRKRFGL